MATIKSYRGEEEITEFINEANYEQATFAEYLVSGVLFVPNKKGVETFFSFSNGKLVFEEGKMYICQNAASYKPSSDRAEFAHSCLGTVDSIFRIELSEKAPQKAQKVSSRPMFSQEANGIIYQDDPEVIYQKDNVKFEIKGISTEFSTEEFERLLTIGKRWKSLSKKMIV